MIVPSRCLIWVDDQLQELGGDQTYDYVALNREVVQSGILYGLGLLAGPYVRETKGVVWEQTKNGGLKTSFKDPVQALLRVPASMGLLP